MHIKVLLTTSKYSSLPVFSVDNFPSTYKLMHDTIFTMVIIKKLVVDFFTANHP